MITSSRDGVVWPHQIKAVAFDMDGLLINTEELYFDVFEELMQRRDQHYTDELRRAMMGLPAPQAFAMLIDKAGLKESADELEQECDEIFSGVLPDRLAVMPGVIELLTQLERRGLPHCVATSSRRSFADECLEAVGVLERFDFIVTAAEVARGKPHPDIYLEAARRMGVATSNMLVLEDSQNGARAGVAAGSCTIAVPGDHSRDHDFTGVFAVVGWLGDANVLKMIGDG